MNRFDEEQREEYRRAQQRKKRNTTGTSTGERRRVDETVSGTKKRRLTEEERTAIRKKRAEAERAAARKPLTEEERMAVRKRQAEAERTATRKRPTEEERTAARKPLTEEERVAARRRRMEAEKSATRKRSSEEEKMAARGRQMEAEKAAKNRRQSEQKRNADMLTDSQRARARERARQRAIRSNRISRNVGLIMTAVQAIASIVFMVGLFTLDMFPNSYLLIIFILLLLFCGIILVSQFFSKKKAISGKVLSVIITLILIVGSYYLFKMAGAISSITSGDYKLDNVVVAVMAEDGAETLEDAADYTFGVQYQMKGSQIEDTVEAINEELGIEIKTKEYDSVADQAVALHEGEVDAIIYNEGYTSVLEEGFPDFVASAKVIYEHSIKSELVNLAANVAVDEEPFAVYISGIDVYGEIETNSRSDVNILAFVNPKSHQILLVTTPRDYFVASPEYTGGVEDKLAHIAIHGVDASMDALENLYDTEIDFYARVNFTSLIEIVDALGGVDVNSELAFTTGFESGVIMQVNEGMNHFNGEEALAFCRERKNLAAGDNQRGKHQQAVITAMIQKMVSPAILMGAGEIIESVSGNVDTNMSMEQLQDLIKVQLKESPTWDIKSMAAEGIGSSAYCYSYSGGPLYVTIPDEDSVQAIKDNIDMVMGGEVLDDTVSTEGNE